MTGQIIKEQKIKEQLPEKKLFKNSQQCMFAKFHFNKQCTAV